MELKSLLIIIVGSIAFPLHIQPAAKIIPQELSPAAPAASVVAKPVLEPELYEDPPLIQVIKSIDPHNEASLQKARAEIAMLLSDKKTKVDASDGYGKTALIWAFLNEVPYDIITKLLGAGANINAYFKPYVAKPVAAGTNPWLKTGEPPVEETLLLYFIRKGNPGAVHRLINTKGIDITLNQHIITPDGYRQGPTALQLAIDSDNPNLTIANLIINKSTASINRLSVDSRGTKLIPLSSVFINSALTADQTKQEILLEIARKLFDNHAFMHYEQFSNGPVNPFIGQDSPLSLILSALDNANEEAAFLLYHWVTYLLKHARDNKIDVNLDFVNITTGYPLPIAVAIKGDLEAYEILLKYQDFFGHNMNRSIVRHKGHPDDGNTVLMQVIVDQRLSKSRKKKMIIFLLDHGADLSLRNEQGKTVSKLAATSPQILDTLTRHANPTILDTLKRSTRETKQSRASTTRTRQAATAPAAPPTTAATAPAAPPTPTVPASPHERSGDESGN